MQFAADRSVGHSTLKVHASPALKSCVPRGAHWEQSSLDQIRSVPEVMTRVSGVAAKSRRQAVGPLVNTTEIVVGVPERTDVLPCGRTVTAPGWQSTGLAGALLADDAGEAGLLAGEDAALAGCDAELDAAGVEAAVVGFEKARLDGLAGEAGTDTSLEPNSIRTIHHTRATMSTSATSVTARRTQKTPAPGLGGVGPLMSEC